MKMTRRLPTDRSGQVYYGPKTIAQARASLDKIQDAYSDQIDRGMPAPEARRQYQNDIDRMVSALKSAGYPKIAAYILPFR